MTEPTRPIQLSRRETLGEYVRRLLDERGLSLKDVELRSGGRIGHSYVHVIASGQTKNLTVEKIRGLAAGLGLMEEEVFSVVCDPSSSERAAFRSSAFARLYRIYEALER
jgi:transcriptional regulator with XRE-family HTH domain